MDRTFDILQSVVGAHGPLIVEYTDKLHTELCYKIEQKHIDRITERFYRVDPDRSRDTGGTGLGLSIVKNIIKQHNGELKITSDIGKGSSFKLIFDKESII